MKILSKRAAVVLILTILIIFGLVTFTVKYVSNASAWVQYPTNRHLYYNGKLVSSGTIYDRNGDILFQTVEGSVKFNNNNTVRKAVMHAVGDANGNISTSAQVVFAKRLTGWNLLDGTYKLKGKYTGGEDLTLTLDAGICSAAYSALNGRKGTVGVYNYKTGEIICMVSSPSFDPQNPPDIAKNPEKYEGVYINRLLSATYTPGSVFKLVTAAAAVDNLENIDSKVYNCEGEMIIGGQTVTCPSAHGRVALGQALSHSCNVAFAQIAVELGAEALQKYTDMAGLNTSLDVNGIKTAKGSVNVAGAEGGDLAWAGIGQYHNLVNPLNIMVYMGAIANDGVCITPIILLNKDRLSFKDSLQNDNKRILTANTARDLGKMMRNAVKNVYGETNYSGLEMCAKSGTAEVGEGKRPHSWFAGFLDREDYPYAFVVVVENGGSGSKVAGPVAAKVLKAAVK